MDITQVVEDLKIRGHKCIFNNRYSQWDEYVESITESYQVSLVGRAVSIMERLEENPSYENISAIARELVRTFDDGFLVSIRGILFNFSKLGPEFCLAMEYAVKEQSYEYRMGTTPTSRQLGDISISAENVELFVQKMLENRTLSAIEEKKQDSVVELFEDESKQGTTESVSGHMSY